MLKATDPAHYQPAPGALYPNGSFGDSMKQIAQLLKANLGVEAAFTDIGGWDTHQNQGSVNGQLANSLRTFGEGISAFWTRHGRRSREHRTLHNVGIRQNNTPKWHGWHRSRPC